MSEGQSGEGRRLFCRVIEPERVLYDGEADLVVARIADGDIGVMVDHAPVVSMVEIGAVRITQDDQRYVFATSDGFFKVSENLVQILVEEAENELSEIPEDDERRQSEVERRRAIGENLARVAREYGEG